jgi:cysteinyl-tRNA synthetase
MLQIYNTQTGTKTTFQSRIKHHVDLYVCGITVYDLCHIGHGRTYLCFDMIRRYLSYLGYHVNYVRNITDIDDKIIQRAQALGRTESELVTTNIDNMYQDLDALFIERPSLEPRATDHVTDIIEMVEALLAKGHAYIADNGDVLFSIASYADYGQLSKQNLEQLQAGARVEIEASKHNAMDFVLWKMAKPNEPSWSSPWGEGRPGWHIECSAMSFKHLGGHFDIHGGGADLTFPHHENERAQSCCATAEPFVNTWMHTGMVMVNQEKMSKSLGNFFTIRDVLKHFDPETVRFFLLSAHYRSQLNYSDEQLKQARSALERLYGALRDLDMQVTCPHDTAYEAAFTAAMNDDFNTPEAYAVLFELAKEINALKEHDHAAASALAVLLRRLAQILGLMQQDADAFFQGAEQDVAEIEALIEQRRQARANRDWDKADALRDALQQLGIELEDKDGQTRWRRLS